MWTTWKKINFFQKNKYNLNNISTCALLKWVSQPLRSLLYTNKLLSAQSVTLSLTLHLSSQNAGGTSWKGRWVFITLGGSIFSSISRPKKTHTFEEKYKLNIQSKYSRLCYKPHFTTVRMGISQILCNLTLILSVFSLVSPHPYTFNQKSWPAEKPHGFARVWVVRLQ